MVMEKNFKMAKHEIPKIKKGQWWKNKQNGIVVEITGRSRGARYWNLRKVKGTGKDHHIHDGTLTKYFVLLI